METLNKRGRKFVIFQEMIILTVLYAGVCAWKPELSSISNVIMTVIGAGAAYMAANAYKGKK